MEEEQSGLLARAADDTGVLLENYLRERVFPHPILSHVLPEAAVLVTGSVAIGAWDEQSALDIFLIVPDDEHVQLSAALREARLWDPARDYRLRLEDREPFRRFPGTVLRILSASELERESRFDLPVTLWVLTHALVHQDPLGTVEAARQTWGERFTAALSDLRCEHYYYFREARNDLVPRIMPRRMTTLMAIKRGEAVREALRLAFLADGKPYPYDKWLEVMAERETRCGASIVTAVRALVAARDPQTVEHTGKVLRDRVAFALQQGGVREAWLEQWWLWPSIAPPGPSGLR